MQEKIHIWCLKNCEAYFWSKNILKLQFKYVGGNCPCGYN